MPQKRILIVHPNDKTTSFLDKIKNHLIEAFGEDVHHFNVHANDKSHTDCLECIAKHSPNGLVIFLGHGRSDKLHGSKGDLYESLEFASKEAIDESPDKFYYKPDFINAENVNVFKGKKVFCLACNSNEKIGRLAFECGSNSFFGFGDIPTSSGEFTDKGEKVGNEVVARMKAELCYIVKTSLVLCIKNEATFQGLKDALEFISNQRLADLLKSDKNFKERYLLADQLYYLKKDATIYGDRHARIV